MFAGSLFFGSYAGHHGCCEFMNVMDNIPTRQHFMAFPPMFLIFYILSLAHSEMFPEPWQRVGDNIGVPFKVEDARYRKKKLIWECVKMVHHGRGCHATLSYNNREGKIKRNRKGKRSNISLASTPQ